MSSSYDATTTVLLLVVFVSLWLAILVVVGKWIERRWPTEKLIEELRRKGYSMSEIYELLNNNDDDDDDYDSFGRSNSQSASSQMYFRIR